MPVDYDVLDDPPLVLIRYHGHVEMAEITRSLSQFAAEGRQHDHQTHLFDISGVTSYTLDYPEYFRLLGKLADVYPVGAPERLFVFLAPSGPPAEMVAALRRPYDGSGPIVIRVADTVDAALDILGLPHASLETRLLADR